MDNQLKKEIAIINELDSSIKLIELGFGELQNLDKNESYYFLPFQLLSQGFERFMKCYICFGYLNQNGEFPPPNYLKKQLGHDLLNLLNEIWTKYFDFKDHPILINDFEVLTNNKELRELLYILSEFGKQARYHNFDIITGSKSDLDSDPESHWRSFEFRLITEKTGTLEKILDAELSYEVHGEIVQHIIVIFEKFMSSLSRQFLHDCIGEKAKQYSSPVFDFALMNENKFGIKDYRKKTTRFQVWEKKRHRRTIVDFLQRKFNRNFKSKRIKKGEIEAEWPFYDDEVIVECRYDRWYIITIGGYDYGLNGSAKSRYKLDSPLDGGMAILGKNVDRFIEIARNL
jgi:hypothetical protein